MKRFILRFIPTDLKKSLKSLLFGLKLKKTSKAHSKELLRVKKKFANKEKIRVAFLVIHDSVFKYHDLYRLMDKSECFKPIIFVCPYSRADENGMKRDLQRTFDTFKKMGFNVFLTLSNGKWYDIKKEYNPDFVFFTNPWEDITLEQYSIRNFLDTLTCYVPYGFKISHLYEAHFNKEMHCLTWKFFLETKIHQELSKKYSRNKALNTVVLGYPGGDIFINNKANKNQWISNDESIKRIIWAPHHTLPGMGANLDYSTFLIYSEFMVELTKKFLGKIEFAFKPHPMLRHKLSREEYWGEKKTNDYFDFWKNSGFTILEEGDYKNLFLSSDALIHDSGSFVAEYLYVNKPVLFLFSDYGVFNRFNEIGKMALECAYKSNNESGVIRFIEDKVLNGHDDLKEKRIHFFNSYLLPPNNKSASENIYEYVFNKIV
jgi:hypothetical protein